MTANVIFASYGNDSCALIQWAAENELKDVTVLYSDTGWASDAWSNRVTVMEDWVRTLGFTPVRTSSIGLEALVKERKGWPRQGLQFCTQELKIIPAMNWLDTNDPDKKATCYVGVRRSESANRREFPEYQDSSPAHGGRALSAPLANHSDEQRDELLARAGVAPLPHRSMECFPCINSNRTDLRELAKDTDRIAEIARIEGELGYTSKGKPRTMFRAYRHMGATGIHEIVAWAQSDRGKFQPSAANDNNPAPANDNELDDGGGAGCEQEWCGL